MDTDEKRGTAYHEAGHAIVLHSLDVPVEKITIAFAETRGWYGNTDPVPGFVERLHYTDQVMSLIAGSSAEALYCSAYDGAAARDDLGKIDVVLEANNVPVDQHWSEITKADERATAILKRHETKARKVAEHLVATGHMTGEEFAAMMRR